jgi:hypothetical protein
MSWPTRCLIRRSASVAAGMDLVFARKVASGVSGSARVSAAARRMALSACGPAALKTTRPSA